MKMRDKNRLDKVYEEICNIHKQSFPDMRFGQYMLNVLGWIYSEKKKDPFFIEENKIVNFFKEYANNNSPFYRGWEIL